MGAIAKELCASPHHVALLPIPHPSAHIHHRTCTRHRHDDELIAISPPKFGVGGTGDIEAGNEGQARPPLCGGFEQSTAAAPAKHAVDGVDAACCHLHEYAALVVP